MAAAATAISRAGFLRKDCSPSGDRRFIHESGLPVALHDRLYRSPFYNADLSEVWSRTREALVLGIPVRVMSDVDLLVLTPVHASLVRERSHLGWILDVVSLLMRREREGATIDWSLFAEITTESRVQLPLFIAYHYLATRFRAPIPHEVIDQLRRSADTAGRLQHLRGP